MANPTDSFIDEVTISVSSGDGGNGCRSFHREKYVARGGPDGGDGGRGGDVLIIANSNLSTLLDHRPRRIVRAKRGVHGRGRNKHGKAAPDVILRVPVGTMIFDADAGPETPALADLTRTDERFVAVKGGRGGRGNARFATSTRQAPDFSEEGQAGESRRLRFELKLLADVGFVGLPNAGKSTLLRRVSSARPRVADYPFTTLVPALGVAESGERRFVVADIPGLIEGASEGAGLGDRFLRHIERTRVLIHLLDLGAATLDGRDPLDDYDSIRHELGAYDPSLLERTEIVALNKLDLLADREAIASLESDLRRRGCETIGISAATGEGVAELVQRMAQILDSLDAAEAARDAEVTA